MYLRSTRYTTGSSNNNVAFRRSFGKPRVFTSPSVYMLVLRTTPLIFLAKFTFKLYMHGSERTVVIKIPLVRNVMPKRDLAAFLRSREEQRSSRRSALDSSRSANGRSTSHRPVIGPPDRD
jgi:hypothetical protein